MRSEVPSIERALIGSGSQYFWNVFQQFRIVNTDLEEFNITWNWSSFILGGFWFAYRKVYLWSGILIPIQITLSSLSFIFGLLSENIIISVITDFLNLMIYIGSGMTSNFLYYSYIKAKANKVRSAAMDEQEALNIAQHIGGVNVWVTWISVPVTLFFILRTAFVILEFIRQYVQAGLE